MYFKKFLSFLSTKKIQDAFAVAHNIEFANSVGVIINKRLLIHSFGEQLIAINAIKKIELQKNISFIYNILFILITFPLAYMIYHYKLGLFQEIILCVHILLFIGMACVMRKTSYRLIILMHDGEHKIFSLHKKKKKDAKTLVALISNRIAQATER